MNFINKLNRKFGKYAIHNLMFYIIILYATGYLLFMINPNFYERFLSLDVKMILKGQIWRLATFIIQPPNTSILFLALELYIYYMIGTNLERAWGAFRFNLYFLSGILFNILATIILYLITGISFSYGLIYINRSLFFAFAALYPNVQFLLLFILPVKVKYLAYFYGAFIIYEVIKLSFSGVYGIALAVAILVSLGNFLIYFLSTRNYQRLSPSEYKRKTNYKKQVKAGRMGNVVDFNGRKTITRHKCTVCGRTEMDDDNLEFRFCSKCEGNYEYCMDHLFTHEHVKKQ
jgi:hypothetical protein